MFSKIRSLCRALGSIQEFETGNQILQGSCMQVWPDELPPLKGKLNSCSAGVPGGAGRNGRGPGHQEEEGGAQMCKILRDAPRGAAQSSSSSGWTSWRSINSCPDWWSPRAQPGSEGVRWGGEARAALRWGNGGRRVLCFRHPKSQHSCCFKTPTCSDGNKPRWRDLDKTSTIISDSR